MGDYLHHWWNGDLNNFYHFFGLTISQLNKIAKIILYFSALLTLFEFIKFVNFVKGLKITFGITIFIIRFIQILTNLPLIVTGLVLGFFKFLLRNLHFKEIPGFAFWYYISKAGRAALHSAESHFSVRLLEWFEKQPITEKGIKKFGFFLIVIFACIEVFTS